MFKYWHLSSTPVISRSSRLRSVGLRVELASLMRKESFKVFSGGYSFGVRFGGYCLDESSTFGSSILKCRSQIQGVSFDQTRSHCLSHSSLVESEFECASLDMRFLGCIWVVNGSSKVNKCMTSLFSFLF